MDRSSSWTNARNGEYVPPSRVARMVVPSPRPPPGSTAEAVATARRAEHGSGGGILPVLSPNASKRSSWTTPRSPSGDSEADSEAFAPPPRRAELAARRAEPVRQRSVSDGLFASEMEQAQLAYMEQMYGTINLLNAELETERRQRAALESAGRSSVKTTDYFTFDEDMGELDEPPTGFVVSQTPVAPSYSPRKLRAMPSPPSHPPQHQRTRPPVTIKDQDDELCTTLGKNAELRIRSRDMERTVEKTELELELARKQLKVAERRAENREDKLRALLKEKLQWQKELKATRAQVVEEKMRQVDLFREVEAAKRHFAAELEAVEHELRAVQEDNAQLRTHATEMKTQLHFQTRKMDEMNRQAQDEKARFVAMIEDTRHRFREWKEGEAEALQAAHDQVVRNLKTEYDLKIERHQDEKQKLRDKVHDLEVSTRLLQKDRALSPLELSLRKATILRSKEFTGTVAAEQIETQSRILELENLLAHSQEYQTRQESVIKLSEATISRLMQEREVTALENLSLHPFGVEPQPRMEELSYEMHYVTAPSRPPGTPPRSHQLPVKTNEPPIVRSPKSRAHTPRRADLEASIAQAAEQERANFESTTPSSRELSLMDELEQLRKALAEAQAKAEAAVVLSNADDKQVPVSSGEAEDKKHQSSDQSSNTTVTKVPCESTLPTETNPCQDADEERHSDKTVSGVVSADEIHAASSTVEDIGDSREATLNESDLCEALSSETLNEDNPIAGTVEEDAHGRVDETDAGSRDEPLDRVDAQEEDRQPSCSEMTPNASNGDVDDSEAAEAVFEKGDDTSTTEELVPVHEDKLSENAMAVVESAESGDDVHVAVVDTSEAAPLEEVDSSLQTTTEELAVDGTSPDTEGQEECSNDATDQIYDIAGVGSDVCENAEPEVGTGEVAAVDVPIYSFAGEEPEAVVKLEHVDVDKPGGDSTEIQESDVEVPADADEGKDALGEDIDAPGDTEESQEQNSEGDTTPIIGSENGDSDTKSELMAPEELALDPNTTILEQAEGNDYPSALSDKQPTDLHDFDCPEAPISVADSVDSSIAVDTPTSEEFQPEDNVLIAETVEANNPLLAVESEISISSLVENDPVKLVEDSRHEVIEPCEEVSNTPSDVVEGNAQTESMESTAEIGTVEVEVVEEGTQGVTEPREERSNFSPYIAENELFETPTASIRYAAETDTVEVDVVEDDTQSVLDLCTEASNTSSDAAESEFIKVESTAEVDIVEVDTQVSVKPCTGDDVLDALSEPSVLEFSSEGGEECTNEGEVVIDSIESTDNTNEEEDKAANSAQDIVVNDARVGETENNVELSTELPSSEAGEENEAVLAEVSSGVDEEVGPQDMNYLPEFQEKLTSEKEEEVLASSPTETPLDCVAEVVVALVERTALSFVASLLEVNRPALDAVAGTMEESPFPIADVVSEDDGVGLIDVLGELEDPTIVVNTVNDDIVVEVAITIDNVPGISEDCDVDAPGTAVDDSNEVNVAAEEHPELSDGQPELSFVQENHTTAPSEDPDVETESFVALTTKVFAENFVKEVMEMLASSDETQKCDDAATESSVGTVSDESISVDVATPVLVERETSAYLPTTETATDVTADASLVDNEIEAEALDLQNAEENSSSAPCDPSSNTVPENSQSVEQAEQTTDAVETVVDNEIIPAVGQIDDSDLELDRAPTQDTTVELASPANTLTIAKTFVSDVETKALSTVLLWLQKGNSSEGENWDNEELESNSTRSIIGSWNLSEEQTEINVTPSEPEVPSEVEPTIDTIEASAASLAREIADEPHLSYAHGTDSQNQPRDGVESVMPRTDIAQTDNMDMLEFEELIENDAKYEKEVTLEPASVADIEGLTAAHYEVSTQEIVSDVACLFASRTIAEVLNRLSQPCCLSEDEENDRDLNEISNNDEDEAGGDTVEGDDSKVEQLQDTPEESDAAEDGTGAEEPPVRSSEEINDLPVDTENGVSEELNSTNYEELSSSEVPSENSVMVNEEVSDLIESMVVVVVENEVELLPKEETELVPASEFVSSSVTVETESCVGIDDGIAVGVPPDERVCANSSLPSAETDVAVDEEVPSSVNILAGMDSAAVLQIEGEDDVMGFVLTEMIDKVITAMMDQSPSFNADQESDVVHDPTGDATTELASPLKNDDIEAIGRSLEDPDAFERTGETELTTDAVDEEKTTMLGPAVENQDEDTTRTVLVDKFPTAIESENEAPQEILPSTGDSPLVDSNTAALVPDMEVNASTAEPDVLETSTVEDNVIDAIVEEVVTAIEIRHQVDEPAEDFNTDTDALSIPAEPCPSEGSIDILPSPPTEPVETSGESTEAIDAQVDEMLMSELDVVDGVYQFDAVEPVANSFQDEDVAVVRALENLVDAVEAASTAVDITDEPGPDGEGISEDLALGRCESDGIVETTTDAADTLPPDNVEGVGSLYDLAVQSGVERVIADLCTSVERKCSSRHGGRARSVHFAGGTKDESFDRQKLTRRSVLLWEAPVDAASTKESVESSAKRRASKRRVSRRTLADLLAFPTELARFTASDTTLLAYDARLEQGQIFSLLDQSILTINPDGRHIHLDDQDERLGSQIIGKRRTLTQELHSKNLALRQIPRFNYMSMSIKFQWSDFVVATPVRPSTINFGEGHIAKSPVEPMRLLQKKGAKLPCGNYVIVSAFIRPLEDGNENLRVQIYDSERVEEFQFDFSEDIMKKYHLEFTGMEAQALEFLGHLEFRRDEDTIIIKLPEKKAGESSKMDADRIKSERTMVGGGDPRKREPPSKQSRMNAYRQKRPASSPEVTNCQDSVESSSSSRDLSSVERISELDRDLHPVETSNADGSEIAELE
ncbi:hypothetical protein PF008_g689 [Phytophthora fragariae]|uniref:Uncharacterized protein n=1 Tax=Phytophthora fragariae TaxID=53985 RepID=A0A6G0SMH4_9STRA|nr:hypothetical protein PF008_g689 [Phytophthora fragariae]